MLPDWTSPISLITCLLLLALCACSSETQSQVTGTVQVDSIQVKPEPLFDTVFFPNGKIMSVTSLKKIDMAPAQPSGGMDSLRSYVKTHLQYPPDALAQQIEGSVIVILTIEADGSLTIFDAFDLGYGTREAAVEVLLETAPWQPAIDKETGEPITSTILVPINFNIHE